jgi:hypothetical protein
MKRSPDSNSLCGAQPTKSIHLDKSSEDEVISAGITSTSAYNESENNGPITHLPNELLECILLKLSYDEISKVRQVCVRFRDVGNSILNRELFKLQNCVISQLAAVLKERNALLGNTMQSGSGSTGRGEYNSTDPKAPSPMDRLKLIEHRKLLLNIYNLFVHLRFIRNRQVILRDVVPNIHCSSSFFGGKIIDAAHRTLRLVRTKGSVFEYVNAFDVTFLLCYKWIRFIEQIITTVNKPITF